MRVFLDANVLFTAAHNSHGKAAFIIELGAAGHFSLFTSDAALMEAERNLAAKYPRSLPCSKVRNRQSRFSSVTASFEEVYMKPATFSAPHHVL